MKILSFKHFMTESERMERK